MIYNNDSMFFRISKKITVFHPPTSWTILIYELLFRNLKIFFQFQYYNDYKNVIRSVIHKNSF